MDPLTLVNPHLTRSDLLVLRNLIDDIEQKEAQSPPTSKIDEDPGYHSLSSSDEDLLKPSSRFSALSGLASTTAQFHV